MEYEFDPTLTPVAQNRYAEGMVGDVSNADLGISNNPGEESTGARFEDREQQRKIIAKEKLDQAIDEAEQAFGIPLEYREREEQRQPSNEEYVEGLKNKINQTRDPQRKESLEEELRNLEGKSDKDIASLKKEIEKNPSNLDLRKELIYAQLRKEEAANPRKNKRAEIDEDVKILEAYNPTLVAQLKQRLEQAQDNDDTENVKKNAEDIAKEQAVPVTAIRNIIADTWRVKSALTDEKGEMDERLKENWGEIHNLLQDIAEANASGDLARARDSAIELASIVRPYYQAVRLKDETETELYWVPKNAEELWEKISKYQSEEFAPGGEYALVDIRTKINPDTGREDKEIILNEDNIVEWLRREIQYVHKFNSTSESKIFESISIRAGVTNFQIFELLFQKKYWLHQERTPDGGVTNVEYAPYTKLQDMLFLETWKYMLSHDNAVAYRQAMGSADELAKALGGFYSAANYFTADRQRLREIYCMGSTDKRTHPNLDNPSESEIKRKLGDEAYQGTLGKAGRAMQLAYDYMAEVMMVKGSSQYERMRDEDTGKYLNNLFLESLGNKKDAKEDSAGVKEFYRTIIRDILIKDFPGTFTLAESLVKGLNRGRKDWEKFDVLDLLFQGEKSFKNTLDPQLRKKYEEMRTRFQKDWVENGKGSDFDKQLDALLIGKSATLKRMKEAGRFGMSSSGFDAWIQAFEKGNIDEKAFAVELARQVWAPTGGDSGDVLNVFSFKKKGQVTNRVRTALIQAMAKRYKLRTSEVDYAEGQIFDLAYLFGSAAKNDVNGITFNKWSEWQNSGRYRAGQTDFKNGYGNPANIPGLKKLSFTFLEGIRVKIDGESGFDSSLKKILQGGEGNDMDLDKDLLVFDFEENASVQFHADHITNVAAFNKNLNNIEVEFNKLITHDPRTGASIKNFEAFQQFINNYWKPLRYAETNANPPFEEMFRSWQYKDRLVVGSKINRPSTITTKKLKNLMFSDDVLNLDMPDVANDVFLYLFGSQIALHLPPLCHRFGFKRYGVDEINELYDLLAKASRATLFDGQDITLVVPVVSEEQWKKMLKTVAKTMWWKLYADAYGWDFLGMSKDMFTDLFGQFFKSIAFIGGK